MPKTPRKLLECSPASSRRSFATMRITGPCAALSARSKPCRPEKASTRTNPTVLTAERNPERVLQSARGRPLGPRRVRVPILDRARFRPAACLSGCGLSSPPADSAASGRSSRRWTLTARGTCARAKQRAQAGAASDSIHEAVRRPRVPTPKGLPTPCGCVSADNGELWRLLRDIGEQRPLRVGSGPRRGMHRRRNCDDRSSRRPAPGRDDPGSVFRRHKLAK